MIVTIDGPAGSGKSTAARGLAARLGFDFLDTGAMYRVVAEECLRRGVAPDDDAAGLIAAAIEIEFDAARVLADGRDVTAAIRTPEVTRAASVVALNAQVRAAMADQQRRHAHGRDIVSEGRDQGTFVFPNAQCKFFLIAHAAERARRRHRELQRHHAAVALQDVLEQMHERDRRDQTRAVAPLKPAADAVRIDTTELSPEQVLDRMEAEVRSRMDSDRRASTVL
ncbi:MAG TPA: (d)CMP kinase [Planctomycetaceae bacterium]|nr:(d)CMP kinase [Planctomycetaceae bacterium]